MSIRCVMQDEMVPQAARAKEEDRMEPETDPLVQAAIDMFGSERVKVK